MPRKVKRTKWSETALEDRTLPADVRPLIADLSDADGTVRHAARESLVAIGRPAVLSLIEVLQAASDDTRWEAAKALGEIHDKNSAAALVLALEDKNFGVRWLAAEGLVALGEHTLPALYMALVERDDSIWLREGALHVLNQLAKQGLREQTQPVVVALEGPAPAVAVPAAARDAIEKLPGARPDRGTTKRRMRSNPQMRRNTG